MSSYCGTKINRAEWIVFTIPNEVMDQAHRLAVAAEKDEGFVFNEIEDITLKDLLTEDYTVTSNQDDRGTTISDDTTGVYNNVTIQNDVNNTLQHKEKKKLE